jgi:hypothetical protein
LITEPIAPLAVQTAPKKPTTNAVAFVPPPFESWRRVSMKRITPCGATVPSSVSTALNRWKIERRPTRKAAAGKKARREL